MICNRCLQAGLRSAATRLYFSFCRRKIGSRHVQRQRKLQNSPNLCLVYRLTRVRVFFVISARTRPGVSFSFNWYLCINRCYCLSIVVVSRLALRNTSLRSDLVLIFGTAIGFWLSGVCSRQFALVFRDHFEQLGMMTTHTFLWSLVSPFFFWLTVTTTLVIIYRPRVPVILVPTLCGVAILMGAVKFFTNELSRAYPFVIRRQFDLDSKRHHHGRPAHHAWTSAETLFSHDSQPEKSRRTS